MGVPQRRTETSAQTDIPLPPKKAYLKRFQKNISTPPDTVSPNQTQGNTVSEPLTQTKRLADHDLSCLPQNKKQRTEAIKLTENQHSITEIEELIKEKPTFQAEILSISDSQKIGQTYGKGEHQRIIFDTFPVLQEPRNPQRSRVDEIVGDIEKIKAKDIKWDVCEKLFSGKPKNEIEKIKENCRNQVIQYLKAEIKYNTDCIGVIDEDNQPLTVVAIKDIKQSTIIGIFAGQVVDNVEPAPTSLEQIYEKQGEKRFNENSWETCYTVNNKKSPKGLIRFVNGYDTGNMVSLIGGVQDIGSGKNPNLFPILIKGHITAYIASNDIKKGSELLVSYGVIPHAI